MARSIQKLQIQALGELLTKEDQLEHTMAVIDKLNIVAMYFDNRSQQFEQLHVEPAFFTTEQSVSGGMKAIIKANIQSELAKVIAEKDAIGSPFEKISEAFAVRQEEAA